ncbi:unnamed protein product, partial [Notodromas monacha]
MPKSPENLVTLSWLNQIMNSFLRIQIQVTNFALEDATPRSKAFAGRICKILVEYTEDPDSVSKTLSLSAKFLPEEDIFAKVAKRMRLFERETMFQHNFVKQIVRMQRVHPDRAMVPHIPKCVYASASSRIMAIVVDDIEEYGFEVQNRQKGLSKDEVFLVMEALAKLHALGFMVLRKHKDRASDMFSRFYAGYPYLSPEVRDAAADRARHAELLLANVVNNANNSRLFGNYVKRSSLPERHQALIETKTSLHSFCHGDCWSGNMMFKYDERSNGTGKPKKVRLLNFEATHYAHPGADLNHFFYTSTSKEVRKHMPEFLKLYYDEFFKYLRLLNVDFYAKNYPYKQFLIDFKRHSEIGLISAVYILPVIMHNKDYSLHVFGDPNSLKALTNKAELSNTASQQVNAILIPLRFFTLAFRSQR